jgi:hypothetical protein
MITCPKDFNYDFMRQAERELKATIRKHNIEARINDKNDKKEDEIFPQDLFNQVFKITDCKETVDTSKFVAYKMLERLVDTCKFVAY